jgi:hypothetical protein
MEYHLLGYFVKLIFLILLFLNLVCQVHFAKILSEHPTFEILAKLKIPPKKKNKKVSKNQIILKVLASKKPNNLQYLANFHQ